MCLALISGLLPIWRGDHAYADDLTAGGGGQLHSAAESPDTKLGPLSREALLANTVRFGINATAGTNLKVSSKLLALGPCGLEIIVKPPASHRHRLGPPISATGYSQKLVQDLVASARTGNRPGRLYRPPTTAGPLALL